MGKSDTIHIACSLNDYYVMPYGVMLVSLFENNRKRNFHIHVFSGQMSDSSINKLKQIAVRYHAQFTFYQLDDKLFANLAESDRISYVTYYRDVIPEVIKPEAEKILYLDGDMIVVGDISSLWDTNIDQYIIAAADDLVAIKNKEYQRLNIPEKFGYFNSGTILINRNEWVKSNITNKILTYSMTNKPILKFLDQDAENFIMHTRRKVLDQKWNQQVGIYLNYSGFDNPYYTGKRLEDIKNNPVIVHFNGMEKPWEYVNLHPFKKDFLHYLKISGLEKPKERIGLKQIAKKQVYRIFGWSWWNRI